MRALQRALPRSAATISGLYGRFQEHDIPNRNRKPSAAAAARWPGIVIVAVVVCLELMSTVRQLVGVQLSSVRRRSARPRRLLRIPLDDRRSRRRRRRRCDFTSRRRDQFVRRRNRFHVVDHDLARSSSSSSNVDDLDIRRSQYPSAARR